MRVEKKMRLPFKINVILLLVILSSNTFSQTFTPIDGMVIGPNFIAFKAEATESDLGYWELITENDPRYQNKDIYRVNPIMGTHLEFTGNNPSSGPPTSPLRYTFVAPKTGTYRLGARMYQRLEGLPGDRCNDVFIKMEGNFTSGNQVNIEDLQKFSKFYGSGVNR